MHLVLKDWILFLRVSKQGPCFTAVEEDEGDRRLIELQVQAASFSSQDEIWIF